MYLEFFGFSEKPFNITPNPRFIFLSKTHREVFAHLLYGIRNHAGFIEVTGEVGTGKTTVLRTLFGQLGGDGYRLALIFNPSLSALELLRSVNREFGLPGDGLSAGELLNALNGFLLEENRSGRTVVLVIDEAQNLEPAVLEQIRLISNLETETDKLIQIILVGQPELGRLLGRSELRQLAQRITVRYHLQSLDCEDACAYVEHRLGVAGWNGGKLFTQEAMRAIHQHSRGVPRLINVLCDRALVVAYGEERREVTATMVARAQEELRRFGGTQLPFWRRPWMLALAGVVMLLIGVFSLSPNRSAPPDVSPEQGTALASVDLPTTADPGAALASLLVLWQATPLAPGVACELPDGLAAIAADRGLGVLRLRGPLPALLQLDTPALLRLVVAGEERFVALTGHDGNRLRLEIAGGKRSWVEREVVAGSYAGEAYLLWRNPLTIPTRGSAWREPPALSQLQQLLAANRLYVGAINGRYDLPTQEALRSFQQLHGLTVDGVPGPQTLLALYQQAGIYGLPRLTGSRGEGL